MRSVCAHTKSNDTICLLSSKKIGFCFCTSKKHLHTLLFDEVVKLRLIHRILIIKIILHLLTDNNVVGYVVTSEGTSFGIGNTELAFTVLTKGTSTFAKQLTITSYFLLCASLPQVKLLVKVLTAVISTIRTWESSYFAPCIDYHCLFLWRCPHK